MDLDPPGYNSTQRQSGKKYWTVYRIFISFVVAILEFPVDVIIKGSTATLRDDDEQ